MRSKYRITKTLSILLMVFSVFFFLFSNHWVYLSHQRFGALANLQMQHLRNLENRLSDVVVVGHRGSGLESTKGDLLIGNTRSAIDVAMEADVDWIEVDVRRTQDGHFVLFHDDTLNAKTNVDGQIELMQLNELASLELLLPDDENRNILSLEEVLAEYQASHPNLNWILDLKLGKTNSTGDGQAERIRQASCFRAELPKLLDRLGIAKDQITIFGDAEIIQAFSDSKFSLGYTLLFASTPISRYLRKTSLSTQRRMDMRYWWFPSSLLPYLWSRTQRRRTCKSGVMIRTTFVICDTVLLVAFRD